MKEVTARRQNMTVRLEREFDYEEIASLETANIDNLINKFNKVNLLPFHSRKIYFKSDIWDFSSFNNEANINKGVRRINFSNCPNEFKEILKVYGLYKILENKIKIQTIKQYINKLTNFFVYANDLNCISVYDLTAKMIDSFLKVKNISVKTISGYRTAMKDFYQLYSIKFKNIRTKEIDIILKQNDSKLIKAQTQQNKTENIADDYYSKFVAVCKSTAIDKSVDDWIRGTACVYLILSQTGLRLGECLNLTTESLKKINYYKGKTNNYLTYRTWKRVRGERGVNYTFTYANDMTIFAINILKELSIYKKRREELGVSYLYVGGKNSTNSKYLPVNTEVFSKQAQRYFIFIDEKLKSINLPDNYYEGITNKNNKNTSKKYQYIKTIAMPTTIQFRVHVVRELINRGVHIKYVQKFMGHLTSEMTAHYATPKDSFLKEQEEVTKAKETLKTIITGDEKLLGDSPNKFIEEIQNFIKENSFNVKKDLDEIIETLINKYPIKQKVGGYLIAPRQIRRTTTDIISDKYYERYGFETSGLTFYYMIDYTYKKSQNLKTIIDYNFDNGFKREAKLELMKLHKTVKELLEPEFKELKNQITKYGINSILEKHPNLLEIIENISTIEEEIERWKKIKI